LRSVCAAGSMATTRSPVCSLSMASVLLVTDGRGHQL
jgi:hypothetical protein